jgi:hypothetical protein
VDNERASWTPRRSETEQRRMDAELLYDLEMGFTKIGRGDPALVFDEEKELFRFVDGRFAFSREHAGWALLRKRGQGILIAARGATASRRLVPR